MTNAFLLGIAIREGVILATFEGGILHMAGEHRGQVHLLAAKKA